MLSVSDAIERIINKTPFLQESLQEGLVNVSALARKIKPDVTKLVGKEIQSSAIVMAIRRMPLPALQTQVKIIQRFVGNVGDVTVRLKLYDYTYSIGPNLVDKQTDMLKELQDYDDAFFTISRGVNEFTIVCSEQVCPLVNKHFEGEKLLSKLDNLASITIFLPKNNADIPGMYYFILRNIAFRGISVVEVISTTHEMTLVVKMSDVDEVFSLLMQLKKTV